MKKTKKPYQMPRFRKLTLGEGRRLLLDRAKTGDKEAKELLNLFFPETAEEDFQIKKKSA